MFVCLFELFGELANRLDIKIGMLVSNDESLFAINFEYLAKFRT